MQLHPSSISTTDPTRAVEAEGPRPAVPTAKKRLSRLQRGLLWAGAILATVLALIFVPPLVNANRYRLQIARSISESLGRPVHLDDVSLHLLPMPGITLSNLVVDEDPAFGDEPTIRANTVEATLRLGSLWRRKVEFSTIRFVEPSVNLVRNGEGRWNLSEVLINASKLDTAPTVQRKAGPAPRFPYIEATGGRVNIKFGEDKLPFSLTEADFALWLPTANQWRVRLKAAPARTDTSIDEPGTVRLEGTLQRAATAASVPVSLRASWHDVPLGDASRFITGDDLGWRGTLDLDTTLDGRLGDAQMHSQVTLDELRRAEFSPSHPLDLQIGCVAGFSVEGAVLHGLACTLPDSAPVPMTLRADTLDLAHVATAQVTVTGEQIPLHWGMLWAALFSPRVPTDLHPAGTLSVHLVHGQAPPAVAPVPLPVRSQRAGHRFHPARSSIKEPSMSSVAPWSGEVDVELPPAPSPAGPAHAATSPVELVWKVQPAKVIAGETSPGGDGHGLGLVLEPVTFPLGPGTSLLVSAALEPSGYELNVNGTATAATLLLPARYLPQLGDGVEPVLPYPPTGTDPVRVEFTCKRSWSAAQTCTPLRPSTTRDRPQGAGATVVPVPQPQTPSLLAPHSLSPLDANPALGGPLAPSPGQTSPRF